MTEKNLDDLTMGPQMESLLNDANRVLEGTEVFEDYITDGASFLHTI